MAFFMAIFSENTGLIVPEKNRLCIRNVQFVLDYSSVGIDKSAVLFHTEGGRSVRISRGNGGNCGASDGPNGRPWMD